MGQGYYILPAILKPSGFKYENNRQWKVARRRDVNKPESIGKTSEVDVEQTLALSIDIDVKKVEKGGTRPNDTNSSKGEVRTAMAQGRAIKEYLVSIDVPETALALAMSGNGCQLLLDIEWAPRLRT